MFVICCGMNSSAGTLLYRVTSDLVELSGSGYRIGFFEFDNAKNYIEQARDRYIVGKTAICHSWAQVLMLTHNAVAVGTYRDPRDIAISRLYRRKRRALGNSLPAIIQRLDVAIKDQMCWESLGAMFFKYEDYWPNMEQVAEKVAHHIGLPVSEGLIDRVESRNTLEESKKIVADGAYDKKTLMVTGHISKYDGMPGTWVDKMLPEQANYIYERHKDWMIEHGYEL